MTISQQIIFFRKKKKITQLAMAEKLGMSLNNYGKLERRERFVEAQLDKIFIILGLDFIITEKDGK